MPGDTSALPCMQADMTGELEGQKVAKRRYFTVEVANRMLPLVRSIVQDFVEELKQYDALAERMTVLSAVEKQRLTASHREEVEEVERRWQACGARLRELLHELDNLGVELKGSNGLVDFPALLHGREIYLCWQLGEPEVMYWHEKDAGFKGRQRITERLRAELAAEEPESLGDVSGAS